MAIGCTERSLERPDATRHRPEAFLLIDKGPSVVVIDIAVIDDGNGAVRAAPSNVEDLTELATEQLRRQFRSCRSAYPRLEPALALTSVKV